LKVKRVLKEGERTTLSVNRLTHALVKAYARKHGLTVAEATWRLLGEALCADAGIEFEREGKEED